MFSPEIRRKYQNILLERFTFAYVCVPHVCMRVCVCRFLGYIQRPEKRVAFPGAGLTNDRVSSLGSRTLTQVLSKSRKCF